MLRGADGHESLWPKVSTLKGAKGGVENYGNNRKLLLRDGNCFFFFLFPVSEEGP